MCACTANYVHRGLLTGSLCVHIVFLRGCFHRIGRALGVATVFNWLFQMVPQCLALTVAHISLHTYFTTMLSALFYSKMCFQPVCAGRQLGFRATRSQHVNGAEVPSIGIQIAPLFHSVWLPRLIIRCSGASFVANI